MNMNLSIVNRALYAAGQETISAEDKDKHNYDLCKSFYLATFLEALSEIEWVGGRRRDKLMLTGRPVIKNEKYRFTYDLPHDCAKPIELQDNEYFVVEDCLLLTDIPNAELLYVSNGKTFPNIGAVEGGGPEFALQAERSQFYFSAGGPGTVPDFVLNSGCPADIPNPVCADCWEKGKEVQTVDIDGKYYLCPDCGSTNVWQPLPKDPPPDSDYPDFMELDYEPKFFEYVEKMLAAKFAVKVTDQPRLHAQLLNDALRVKQEAVAATRSTRAAKVKESPWWADKLGLPKEIL